MRGLRWALFKSDLKSLFTPSGRQREDRYADAASALAQSGPVVAREIVARQRTALDEAWHALGFRFTDEMIFTIELQFLWGIFYEVVRNGPSFPTNGYDRLLTLLILFLVRERGESLESARDHALGVESLFNKGDKLFDAIAERGKLAYTHGGDQHYIDIILALHESGAKEGAYLSIPRAT